ncbi:MAG: hypothetical protein PUP91_17090 [Rhizonema sp. PD37]|nr:hypothetical protein [Rhizonema sp. PD37]
MFKSQKYMNQSQQSIAEEFLNMVETEYALCAKEIKRTRAAIILEDSADLNPESLRQLDFANGEIDAISSYWQHRLGDLIAFLETKDYRLNQELAQKYLKHE